MTFEDLTFVADNYNEDLEANMGWQAQWEAANGYLVVVNAQLPEDGSVLPSAAEAGQLYTCQVWSPDRPEGGETPYTTEADCDTARVTQIIADMINITV